MPRLKYLKPVPEAFAHPRKRAVLIALGRTGNVAAACRHVELAPSTFYDWCRHDDLFDRAVRAAKRNAVSVLEAAAHRVALAGNHVMLIFLLKNLAPETYGLADNVQVRHQVEGQVLHGHVHGGEVTVGVRDDRGHVAGVLAVLEGVGMLAGQPGQLDPGSAGSTNGQPDAQGAA